MSHKSESRFNRVFTSHWFLILCIIGGAWFGYIVKDPGGYFGALAQIYIKLLQVTVIPIIILTITVSVTNLINHPDGQKRVMKIIGSFLILLMLAATTATVVGGFSSPGEGLYHNKDLVQLIAKTSNTKSIEVSLTQEIEADINPNLLGFIVNSVPQNIFQSLSQGIILQIIIFSVILGIALAHMQKHDPQDYVSSFQKYLPAFTLVNNGVLYLLPIGVFVLLASQFSSLNISIVFVLAKLIVTLCLSMTALLIIFVLIIWYRSKKPFKEIIKNLSYIAFMVISTRSSFACIPKCIEVMSHFFDKNTTNLVIPFGNTTCRFGSICFYTIGTIFIANLFVTPLTLYSYVAIAISSVLASLAGSGATGIISLQMITIVLQTVGLPLGEILFLFVTIDPIMDFFETLANVFGNCAASAMSSDILDSKEN